ncbi:MAG: YkgJ family cysteine cluster protein [Methanospirillum sp.]|nr:YkgJ family cysteine cluster protein [Methanospirillum sp.]
MNDPGIDRELALLSEERDLLMKWSHEDLARIISDVGFSCVLCGKCCTSRFNGHVFLLENEAARLLADSSESLVPAPYFELYNGDDSFYVSGYALRVHDDGTCVYLHDNRCRIYENRFSICRIYPYMLHREPDARKRLVFRQVSGLDTHGEYHHEIAGEEAVAIARETIAYEYAWLTQMIEFYTATRELFLRENKRHVRREYDKKMREFRDGTVIQVWVWHQGAFRPYRMRREDYLGFNWP